MSKLLEISRRDLLTTSVACAASFGFPYQRAPAASEDRVGDLPPSIAAGWHTLPVGSGGLVIGFDIAPDGTAVAWSDVGGAYIFTGKLPADATDASKYWRQVMGYSTFGRDWAPATISTVWIGSLGMAIAPTLTSRIYGWFPRDHGANWQWALYYSDDSCGTWTMCEAKGAPLTIYTTDGGSNGVWRRTDQVVAVDPANQDVVYAGMMNNDSKGSGASAGCFVSFDHRTFAPVNDGTSNLPACTSAPGCRGIMFDKSHGTILVGAQKRTKRVILPIGGAEVYESVDGGQTFRRTGLATAAGRSDIAVLKAQMDHDGVYYALVCYGGVPNSIAHLWRYSGPGGTWVELSAQREFPRRNYLAFSSSIYVVVDPRKGHQGFVSVFGPNGIGTGFTSQNANAASASEVTWTGGTGGQHTTIAAPSYDVPYLSDTIANGTGYFTDAAKCIIDHAGYCWWCGQQGVLWYFTKSDLKTPVVPTYTHNLFYGPTTYSVSISRGAEATVAQCVMRPPGALSPLAAMQDVGVHPVSYVPRDYKSFWYPSPQRSDATSLSYAPARPAFVAARVCKEATLPESCGKSGYSNNFGQAGTWTEYHNQPDPLYQATFSASVASNVMTVTSVASGYIMPGAAIYLGRVTGAQSGSVVEQLTNTNPNGTPWREGTYSTTQTPDTASQGMHCYVLTVGGQVVVMDEDHHLVSIFNSGGQKGMVAVTQTATGACDWRPVEDLPAWSWCRRGYASGTAARPFAADEAIPGTVYGIQCFDDSAYGTGFIDDGSGAGRFSGHAGSIMTITAVQSGAFAVGQTVYVGNVGEQIKGKIISLRTGRGGIGTYELDLGGITAHASFACYTKSKIWRSRSYGKSGSWSKVGEIQVGRGGNYTEPLLFAVRGHAGHLFFTAGFTSSGGSGILFSGDGGATWTKLNTPATYTVPSKFAIGKGDSGEYATLFCSFYDGVYGHAGKLHYGAFDPATKTVNWKVLGETGLAADLPISCQFGGITTIDGDWNTHGLIYVSAGTMGFAYWLKP